MARLVSAISAAVRTVPQLQRAMSGHSVRLVYCELVVQIMRKIFSTICTSLTMQNAVRQRFAAQAFHVQRALMKGEAPAHVKLELALYTFI